MNRQGLTETSRHSVRVAAAIFGKSGENLLLVTRRDDGHWEPPVGVLGLNEIIADGFRHEVREETGDEIELGALTGVAKNMMQGVVAQVLRAGAADGTFLASRPEAAEVDGRPLAPVDDAPMGLTNAVWIRDARTGGPARTLVQDGHPMPGERVK